MLTKVTERQTHKETNKPIAVGEILQIFLKTIFVTECLSASDALNVYRCCHQYQPITLTNSISQQSTQ